MARTLRQGGALSACVLGLLLMGVSRPQAQASGPLPAPWRGLDIGGPVIAGTHSYSGGTFSIDGAGTDIGGTSDQFHYVYRQVQGDTDFKIRVASLENVDPWAKAGVMIRGSLLRRAVHAFAYVSAANGVGFLRRASTGGSTTSSGAVAGTAPTWLRIVRQGTQFTAYRGADGVSWTQVGTATITMPTTIYVGLAVTSHNPNAAATATFSEQQTGSVLPSPWTNQDVGSPTLAGGAAASGGTFTVRGGGADIWNSSDQFQFVHQRVQGDVEIIARVASIQQADPWSKAGVMIRESLSGGSRHALMLASAANGWAFQRRFATGGASDHTPGPGGAPPGWVRLVREGSLISAYYSVDGSTWSLVDSDTISMPASVYVGLAVTSHNPAALAAATFTNVAVRAPAPGTNQPPTVSLSSPAPGASFAAPATIGLTAAASDPDGAVIEVDFYAGSQLLGSDTTSPFGFTWSNAAAGGYALRAVATDSDGATATSPIVNISVSAPSNQPPSVAITSPAAGSYSAPASFTIAATATDADGSIARVDFYRGSTLIGSDTTNPYSLAWSNVAAGSYSLTAVATDNGGATRTSTPVSINVTSSTTLPAPWVNQDIGGPTLAGSASASGGTFTVRGGGVDIWETTDQFQFVHQLMQGDVEVVARVATLQQAHGWSKAGVMVRESLSGGSRNALMLVSGRSGLAFQRRVATNDFSASSIGPAVQAPAWVRLVREGNLFSAYYSTDGTTWSFLASDTITMPAAVYVGLAVTSHNPTASATATFTNVIARAPTPGNQPPTVSLSTSGSAFTAPASIPLTAAASDPDGAVVRVDFRAGSQMIGSDTTNPFSVSWTNVPAGNYTITAVATDNNGATATSAIAVSVSAPGNQLPSVSLTSPSAGGSYTAPASFTLTASASDADGTIARVDFYRGSTLIGSDTTSPYSIAWTNVPAGSYSLTAVATDNAGAARTSAAVSITVNGTAPRPTTVVFVPSTSHPTGVTSYSVALRRAGDPSSASPVATRDLGKPPIANGEISVDISTLVDPLAAGSYYAIVSAIGPGGTTPSAPSPNFTK